jgi:biopolymer transport protein TolR
MKSNMPSQLLNRRRRNRLVAEINVVPYIDVMLVLLVIFMITAPLLTQGVNVNMPQAKAKVIDNSDQLPLVISVDRQGNYFLNISATPTIPMTPQQLAVRVAAELQIAQQQGKQRAVLVKGDQDADYGKVMGAMVLLQQAGASNIGLMTHPRLQTGYFQLHEDPLYSCPI